MEYKKAVVGFIGAGGIAKSHAFSLSSLKYYYDDSPEVEMNSVCSAREASRDAFARRFGFKNSLPEVDFFNNDSINTVYILGPNKVHFEHLKAALGMPSVDRIYLEKPICSNSEEEYETGRLVEEHPGVRIQVGFQYLFSTQIRGALALWKSGILGKTIHFDIRYYHGDYLKKEYRNKRMTRLTPAPDGGAMADLGSHAVSLAIAFFGDNIKIVNALQAGSFNDVPAESDLFSLITLFDPVSKAAGTLSASRISSGTGDMISFELYAENGSLKFSTHNPEFFEYYTEETGLWSKQITGSYYKPVTSFPSGHVPPGWTRSMIHAHYVFLTGNEINESVPDIAHGLGVQRIVREASEHMMEFRNLTSLNS